MLMGVFLILAAGFLAGQIVARFKIPKLVGMLLAGIVLGPSLTNLLPNAVTAVSLDIRLFALLIILFKAGLGLDREKIFAQGSVAIRLGFLPATVEAAAVAIAARYIFGWDWIISWLLGWIICAASPAVIVPMMLRLKAQGWGVKKGIPDLILAGGTASDAVAVTMTGIFTAWILGDLGDHSLVQLGNIPLQIVLGLVMGLVTGKLLFLALKRGTSSPLTEGIVSVSAGLGLILGSSLLPYSNYLAVMTMGFTLLESDAVLARRLRTGLERVWGVGEIFLFVLIGAEVDLAIMGKAGLAGLAVIVIGLVIGRWLGIFASTYRSNLNLKERSFMVVGDMAKATVQAAIGGIPLALGISHGDYILAISVLSILVSAPIGALGTSWLAPKLLQKGMVDPTMVTVKESYKIMVAAVGPQSPAAIIKQAARIARPLNAEMIVLNVHAEQESPIHEDTLRKELRAARDINHQVMVHAGVPGELIVKYAVEQEVDYIFLANSKEALCSDGDQASIAQWVMGQSSIPVVLL